MIRRTWIGCWIGYATRSGHGREPRRDLDRPCLGVDVEDLEAGDPLLELPERTVGDDRRGDPIRGDDLGQVGAGQDLGLDELAGREELAVDRPVVGHVGLDLLGLPFLHRRFLDAGLEIDDQHVLGHRSLLVSRSGPQVCPVTPKRSGATHFDMTLREPGSGDQHRLHRLKARLR